MLHKLYTHMELQTHTRTHFQYSCTLACNIYEKQRNALAFKKMN